MPIGPDLTFVSARVFTPAVTYDRAIFRLRDGTAEILDRTTKQPVATLAGVEADLACGDPTQCGDPNVFQRWRLTGTGDERWLAESVSGCGCAGLVQGAALASALEW